MKPKQLLRVVRLRRGTLKSSEFTLRPGEKGLSLFARTDEPSPEEVVSAIRAAGKQGDLAAAVIDARQIRSLGLILRRTPGATPSAEVNAIHYEGRLPLWRRLLLYLSGSRTQEYFNERVSPQLCSMARVLE